MNEQKEQGNRENRKKRRQQEQLQAFGILAAAVAAVIIILVILIAGVNAVLHSSQKAKKKDAEVQQTAQNDVETSKSDAQASNEGADDEPEDNKDPESVSSDTLDPVEDASGEQDSDESDDLAADEDELTEDSKQKMLDSYVENLLETMSLEEKIGAMFLVTTQNLTNVKGAKQAGSTTSAAMKTYAVGGLLYDESNIEDKEQFILMLSNTRNFSQKELFIAVSDEGGEKSPLSLSGLREDPVPSPLEIAKDGSVSDAYSAGINKGSLLRSIGINLNLAPVTDVAENSKSAIASRSYGSEVSQVADFVKSEVKGMRDQGVDCCAKYFPGIGDVTGDTKNARVISKRTKEDLEENEYVIYKDLIEEGIPMIMVSHVSMPKIIGDNTPASLSSAVVTDLLRNDLGFEGVIITDYMNKGAITKYYKHNTAAVMAVQAGVDMIAVPGDFKRAYQGLLSAVQNGKIEEERIDQSVKRILKMKYKNIVDYENAAGGSEEEADSEE